jgi:hypothetical protein
MSATTDAIISAAIQLSEADRLAIVSQLLATVGDEEHLPDLDDEGFIEELQRRRKETADAIPWSQLRDEA